MNHKITQIFVPTSFTGSPTTDVLTSQKLHAYLPSFAPVTVATGTGAGYTTAGNSSDSFIFAIGSGSTKYGSFKTSVIDKKNVLAVTKTSPDTSVKQQITYIGFDEVNDGKTPSFACDEEYVVTLKIDEYWSKGVFQPMIQESVRVKTACCADCSGGCDSLGCSTYMSEVADKINASPLLGKYVTATYVYKGSLPTYKWTLTYKDPGDSTAETAVLTTLRSVYASYVTTPSTDIVITADTDGDSDADSLGNTMYELTPLASVTSLPNFNGVAWEKVLVSAGSVTACGVKIEGKVLDEFGNACVPDAVPYVFNLVRFKVNVHEGPYNTQDFDIENFCAAIPVTTTQDIKYPLGVGVAMAEMERHYFTNNLPATADARRYWNPIYNEDSNGFLYVSSAKTYIAYEVTYLENSPIGFEKKSENTHSVLFLVDATLTTLASELELFLEAFADVTL
jgi:hypothetical protein